MGNGEAIVFSIFLIFSGAALLSTLALFTRQSLLVSYIFLGVILGPWGTGLIADATIIKQVGDVGIIFLLFLLGLHLHPQKLWHMLRRVTGVALISSLAFAASGYGIAFTFGMSQMESVIVGAAMMFSSTIIGLKLLPTTILHHQHIGELMISVLLLQDLIAIVVLLLINGAQQGGITFNAVVMMVLGLPGLLLFAFLVERYVLVKLIARFDRIKEFIFIVSIAWCLGMAEMAKISGLTEEIGAFIGGVALAASPIALYIAESLKPLRDFFLVMFFFSIGAGFNLDVLPSIIIPALLLAGIMLLLKPVLFRFLFGKVGEPAKVGWEVGVRLGQVSEFSLLVTYLAMEAKLLGENAGYLIQATTLLTFIASSYIVVLRYPTPMAISDRMRQD